MEDLGAELAHLPEMRPVLARLDSSLREVQILNALEIELLSSGKTAAETAADLNALRQGGAQNSHSDTRNALTPVREGPRTAGNGLPDNYEYPPC